MGLAMYDELERQAPGAGRALFGPTFDKPIAKRDARSKKSKSDTASRYHSLARGGREARSGIRSSARLTQPLGGSQMALPTGAGRITGG